MSPLPNRTRRLTELFDKARVLYLNNYIVVAILHKNYVCEEQLTGKQNGILRINDRKHEGKLSRKHKKIHQLLEKRGTMQLKIKNGAWHC